MLKVCSSMLVEVNSLVRMNMVVYRYGIYQRMKMVNLKNRLQLHLDLFHVKLYAKLNGMIL